MEDEKKVVKLDEETLEQVSGGSAPPLYVVDGIKQKESAGGSNDPLIIVDGIKKKSGGVMGSNNPLFIVDGIK